MHLVKEDGLPGQDRQRSPLLGLQIDFGRAAGLDRSARSDCERAARAGEPIMSFAYFDWIAHHAEVRGDKTALIDLATQRRLTYRALDERTDRLAAHLASLGVKRGGRVAVLAPNTTD